MKTNILKYFWGLALLALMACSSEDFPDVTQPRNEFAYVEDGNLVVNISLDAPSMPTTSTRGLAENPDYTSLHLYLVEFDNNGSPLRNTLKTVYTPDEETPATDRVNYKVTLNLTDQPRILHLIAVPKDEELNIRYGVEGTIIPALTSTDKYPTGKSPAYWRRLVFPAGYGTYNNDTFSPSAELDQLKHVALIRNFACVKITNNAPDFELKGFAIVNNPKSGTMAPYKTSTYTFPEFLDADGESAQTFTDLIKNYTGIAPAGVSLDNQDSGPVVEDDITPKYMYERPFNSVHHTYIIIKGRRAVDTEDSYYKLDLGKNDNDGVFHYYPILRNYIYNIVLNSVGAKGYSTPLEAAQGVVYNNFSFDIDLQSMLNISYGDEIVFVNFTTSVLTDPNPQELTFKYRYRSLSASSPTYNNEGVNFVGLEPGTVIKSIDKGTTNDADGWRTITLHCYGAQTETKTQSFTIVKPSGLGRTINLILHRKWTLSNVKEFRGTLENWSSTTEGEGTAGDKDGDDLTIFFDIPDNLEESMFPMTFTLESDHQNIENNPLGMLVVTYGTSGFPNIQGRRIKYEKTVTWAQYNDPLKSSDPYDNGTAIDNGNGTFTHRVRCRFKTITNLDNFEFDQSVTKVLITNDNFNNATVEFKRVQTATP